MLTVVPDYYKDFKCIQGACRHSCCIGWEIDIDPDTLACYDSVPGPFGQRLQASISRDGAPHFILGEDERCPFLNEHGLCDVILTLGEDHICGICTDHPRFRNELPGRLEIGLGLCCEEAGRLILGRAEPVALEETGLWETDDEIVMQRDRVIALLQDRTQSIPQRVQAMLDLCGAALPHRSFGEWADFLLALERLDESWTRQLTALRESGDTVDTAAFDAHMSGRQTEYEQFLVYLVWRHLANACDEADLAARAAFAAFGYALVHRLGALHWAQTGSFSFEAQVELARLFSSELEYSEDNLDALLDELSMYLEVEPWNG